MFRKSVRGTLVAVGAALAIAAPAYAGTGVKFFDSGFYASGNPVYQLQNSTRDYSHIYGTYVSGRYYEAGLWYASCQGSGCGPAPGRYASGYNLPQKTTTSATSGVRGECARKADGYPYPGEYSYNTCWSTNP